MDSIHRRTYTHTYANTHLHPKLRARLHCMLKTSKLRVYRLVGLAKLRGNSQHCSSHLEKLARPMQGVDSFAPAGRLMTPSKPRMRGNN
jgi:hypothetical protein